MADERLFFVIAVDIDPEVEDEFNEWYDNVHLPEVVACPGFVSGRRLEAASPHQSPRYAAVYECESKDVMKTPELQAIAGFKHFEPRITRLERYWFKQRGETIAG
jgi:hypothetical protein